MNMTLVFFLGLVSGGLVGIFLVGLVFLLRQGLKNARELKNHSNYKRPGCSPTPELWETSCPVPWLSSPAQVSGQISKGMIPRF